MKKIKQFVVNTIVGGLFIILPILIIIIVFKWLLDLSVSYLKPMAILISNNANTGDLLAYLLAIAFLLLTCFLIGVIVRTKIGTLSHKIIEKILFSKIPGYTIIKETIEQLFGQKTSAFSQVALVNIFNNSTLATGFVTNENINGIITVFVPTGPNPTSGNIYHLDKQYVHKIDISVERVMRSIIGCGTGSDALIDQYIKSINLKTRKTLKKGKAGK